MRVNNNFIRMSQSKMRIGSARHIEQRPSSSKHRKLHQRTQPNQLNPSSSNQETSLLHSHSQRKKAITFRNPLPHSDTMNLSRLVPKSGQIIKEKQALVEQNLHLKNFINRMKDEMAKSKAKAEMLASKSSKYTKQLNREFEKKMYWNGNNSYLVSGIKAQYDKLKDELNEKTTDCDLLKRELMGSGVPELKIYIETLEDENRKLVKKVEKMAQVSQQVLLNASDKNIPALLVDQLQTQLQKMDDKLKSCQQKIKELTHQKKEMHKKIQFLQKLIIQKDNLQYHATKKSKKQEKQKHMLQQRLQKIQNQNKQIIRNCQAKVDKIKVVQERRFKTQKDIFDRTIKDKDYHIQKLEKQVAYLSTLLTYWKPLDELKEVQEKIYEEDDSYHQDIMKASMKQSKKIDDGFVFEQQPSRSRRITQYDQSSKNHTIRSNTDILPTIKESSLNIRVQQTADQKHSDGAEKRRKVEHKQVAHLGQHLRYRFLGLRIPIDEVRKYFDLLPNKPPTNPQLLFPQDKKSPSSPDLPWQQEYISMRQTKQILTQSPFELPQHDAHLIARYLVEDSQNEHVYVDQNNQQRRSIVKSIVRALVGHYEVLEGEIKTKVEDQCRHMMEKYQSNLLAALTALAGSGYISKKKFVELLNSLGIELSEQGTDLLVCKMLLKSQSLEQLNYMTILE